MFRALLCSSSGGQNCIIQHLVSSHSVGGRLMHRLREDWLERIPASPLSTCAWDGHLQVWWYQMLYNTVLTSWWWAQQCSKHVEAYNKLIIKIIFALRWLITEIILRCTVSKTSKHRETLLTRLSEVWPKLRQISGNWQLSIVITWKYSASNVKSTGRISFSFLRKA